MLPLKKFLRYADYGNGTVAVFETGIGEFIDHLEDGPEVDGLPRTYSTVSYAVDANQAVSRSDLEKYIANAKHMGNDTAVYQRVLDEWPVSP